MSRCSSVACAVTCRQYGRRCAGRPGRWAREEVTLVPDRNDCDPAMVVPTQTTGGGAVTERTMPTKAGESTTIGGAGLMLGLATLGFALCFWAWALLSPLAVSFTAALHLTPFQQALLVAVPVVVGSLGRIPVGALTDRFGGRVMFPIISLATVVPVLYLGLFGHSSLAALLVGGFFLGIAGTAFAVGVPFVSAWFPPERRGFAVGVFGAGMGGTAISALTTVKLVDAHSLQTPFIITAVALTIYGAVAALVLRDAPGRAVQSGSVTAKMRGALGLRIT